MSKWRGREEGNEGGMVGGNAEGREGGSWLGKE